jgi:hypothetical protein
LPPAFPTRPQHAPDVRHVVREKFAVHKLVADAQLPPDMQYS